MVSLINEAVWHNRYNNHRCADRKVNQLRMALKHGLQIPDTCITSCVDQAMSFISSHERVIFKSFSGSEEFWQPCRIFEDSYKEYLYSLERCPVIFQEYIDGIEDYRVTVVPEFRVSRKTIRQHAC
jgi:hypothetical protein